MFGVFVEQEQVVVAEKKNGKYHNVNQGKYESNQQDQRKLELELELELKLKLGLELESKLKLKPNLNSNSNAKRKCCSHFLTFSVIMILHFWFAIAHNLP